MAGPSGGSAMGSQGVLTCRDTSSLFNISGDSNGNNMDSHRSGTRSRGNHQKSGSRYSVITNGGLPSSRDFVPIASNQGVRASISKTARLHGEEEENKESEGGDKATHQQKNEGI